MAGLDAGAAARGAAAAAVVLAARGALDTHRFTIEVMHGIGATDLQITHLFQRKIAVDALAGSLIGEPLPAFVLRCSRQAHRLPEADRRGLAGAGRSGPACSGADRADCAFDLGCPHGCSRSIAPDPMIARAASLLAIFMRLGLSCSPSLWASLQLERAGDRRGGCSDRWQRKDRTRHRGASRT